MNQDASPQWNKAIIKYAGVVRERGGTFKPKLPNGGLSSRSVSKGNRAASRVIPTEGYQPAA